MKRTPSSGQQVTPMNEVVSTALEKTLAPLGDGAKTAILFTLEHKYQLPVNGPILTFNSVSHAILDLFGQDGGRLLLEQLWISLEELAESKVSCAESIGQNETTIDREAEFNDQVSKTFADLISEMMGSDVYTWLEGRVRADGLTLKKLYFDADRIADVIYSSFSSGAIFLLNILLVRVSTSMGVSEAHYSNGSSLKASLDGIRQQAFA